jgi:hypothetical protein
MQDVEKLMRGVGLTPPVTDSVPNGAAISDDDRMDSLVCSQHSEPKKEFRDDDEIFSIFLNLFLHSIL